MIKIHIKDIANLINRRQETTSRLLKRNNISIRDTSKENLENIIDFISIYRSTKKNGVRKDTALRLFDEYFFGEYISELKEKQNNICQLCSSSTDILYTHRKNRNHFDNRESNILFLCDKCIHKLYERHGDIMIIDKKFVVNYIKTSGLSIDKLYYNIRNKKIKEYTTMDNKKFLNTKDFLEFYMAEIV